MTLILDLDDFSSADTADMEVRLNGKSTGWTWTFAGPGHPKTTEQGDRIAKAALKASHAKERARVNGKKWEPEEETVEDLRKRNVDFVVDRLIGWSDIQVAGADGKPQPFPFTAENARKLLSDPSKGGLLQQAYSFIGDEDSFTKRSATL